MVAGFNGASSGAPYTLQIAVDPPAPPPQCTMTLPFAPGAAVSEQAPGSGARKTLILVNKQRMDRLYGSSAVTPLMNDLATLAARPDVRGLIVPVETNNATNAAYTAWDADSCNVQRANTVAAAIKHLADRAASDLRSLRCAVDRRRGHDRFRPHR